MMAAHRSSQSVVIKKKNMSKASKKHAAKTLGAVKLRDEAEALSLPCDSGGVVAEESAHADEGKAHKIAAADASAMSRFQNELAETGTTEKWFEEQIASVQETRQSRDSSSSGGMRDTADARQQFHSIRESFKKHLSEMVKAGGSDPRYGLDSLDLSSMMGGGGGSLGRESFHGPSILDLGLDAIQKVGQTWVDIATTVDSTIEQWFDSFQSEEQMSAGSEASLSDSEPVETKFAVLPAADPRLHASVLQAGTAPECRKPTNHQRRSPGLKQSRPEGEGEAVNWLQEEMRRKEAEFHRVQEEVKRLKAELSYTSNKVQALNEENTILRCAPEAHCSPIRAISSNEEHDPISDLMAQQLATLLAEKARLAQDNARLSRENDSLHNFLTMSMSCEEEEDL